VPYLKEHILTFIKNCRYNNDDVRPFLTKLGYEIVSGKQEIAYILPAMAAIHLLLLSFIPLDDIIDGFEGSSNGLRNLPLKISTAYSLSTKLREDAGIIIRKNYGEFHSYKKIEAIISQCLEKLNGSHTLEVNFHSKKPISEYSFTDYLELIDEATSIFIAESFVVGGLLAGADERTEELMHDFGIEFGRLWQIRDDLLDYIDPQITGKCPFADLYSKRKRFPAMAIYWFGTSEQKERIKEILEKDSVSEEDIYEVIDMLSDKGIQERMYKIIEEICDKALHKLELLEKPHASYFVLRELVNLFA
jgi:geranylgeranyl pyrophosphate synthase